MERGDLAAGDNENFEFLERVVVFFCDCVRLEGFVGMEGKWL